MRAGLPLLTAASVLLSVLWCASCSDDPRTTANVAVSDGRVQVDNVRAICTRIDISKVSTLAMDLQVDDNATSARCTWNRQSRSVDPTDTSVRAYCTSCLTIDVEPRLDPTVAMKDRLSQQGLGVTPVSGLGFGVEELFSLDHNGAVA